jgi:hypothetical protein
VTNGPFVLLGVASPHRLERTRTGVRQSQRDPASSSGSYRSSTPPDQGPPERLLRQHGLPLRLCCREPRRGQLGRFQRDQRQPSRIRSGVSHTGTFVSGHALVVRSGQYVAARFYLGRGFAGKLMHVLSATKGAAGHWKDLPHGDQPPGPGGRIHLLQHSRERWRAFRARVRRRRNAKAGLSSPVVALGRWRDSPPGILRRAFAARFMAAGAFPPDASTARPVPIRDVPSSIRRGDRACQNLEVVSERPAVEVVEQYQETGRVPESAARGAENSAWAERRGSEGGFPTRDAAAPRDPSPRGARPPDA